ncbi:MAG TPA: sugar nucleotide-binding protein [Oscillospiraceae bacterium]|jgi:dTDP-4-dehydrorhamnose reductase|nr:sugar nucleotide-binding protein [Oscillospiraceae bacterium]
MKFLVFGASGMAGHTIALYLTEKGHDVTGFDLREVNFCKSIVGDARNTERIRNIIEEGEYDALLNCIGLLNQFADENKELAVFLNSYFPHYLACVTKTMPTQVIHMSTDCVFSGKRGGYREDDLRDGETFYDRSKALGELEDNKNITLRNSIIGPDINANGIGLFNWFMKQKGTINGYRKALWTGLTTLQLAKIMEAAAEKKATGLYNMVNNSPINKYDLLNLFNLYLRNNSVEILPTDDLVVDKSLIRTRFEFDFEVPSYETMVKEMAEWILAHKEMYPHYDL